MADYYDVVRRAVETIPDGNQRLAIYGRARHALEARLRASDPPLPEEALEAQKSALDAAIRRIEAELAPPPPVLSAAPAIDADLAPTPSDSSGKPGAGIFARVPRWSLAAIALLIAIGVGYGTWALLGSRPSSRTGTPAPQASSSRATGVSGPGVSYVFLRQLVYYRSTQPVGTIIIDKGQRFLYMVRPNVAAIRYGIGIGQQCNDAAGLLGISRKDDGPAQALGLRAIYLGNGVHLIHGNGRAELIGRAVPIGCVLLTNEDVVELYDRVAVGGRVVVN